MLFPTEAGEMGLKVWGVTYSQANSTGTTTELELVNEATFSQQFSNATFASSGDRGSSRTAL